MIDTEPRIFAAVMAAGRSSRFGKTKQLATHEGIPLVTRATSVAMRAYAGNVVTVLGYDAAAILTALGSAAGFVVINEDYEQGLGSSIACAARACRNAAGAIVVLMADQPLVTTEHLGDLADAWSGAENRIVATAYDDTIGPPVLFPRAAFEALSRLTGDRGARTLLRDSRFDLTSVLFEPASVDIDLPADLDAIR